MEADGRHVLPAAGVGTEGQLKGKPLIGKESPLA